MSNNYYKSSLIFAIILHATLVLGLLTKFTTSHVTTVNPGSGLINATCVSASSIGSFGAPKLAKLEKSTDINTKPNINTKPKLSVSDLRKDLLAEQAQELAELKQAKQVYAKKLAAKQQQQLQQMLQEQIKAEKQQLAHKPESQQISSEQIKAESQQSEPAMNNNHSGVDNLSETGKIGAVMSAGEFDEYAAKIKQAISAQWVVPDGLSANTGCKLLIKIAPGGMVLDIITIESSGDGEMLERSAKAAVTKAAPLPVPQDLNAFDRFREIKLNFNPSGVVGGVV